MVEAVVDNKKYAMYSYDKQTQKTTFEELDGPTDTWYIKIEKDNDIIYFPSCVSFSKWHGGNCGTSGAYVRAGRCGNWKVYFYLGG